MSSIRGKNTKPELIVRRILWSTGLRYRIHDKTIFGKPDISNKKKKLAIFVDGCFWHGCKRCYREPTTNTDFWKQKIQNNKKRRKQVIKFLKREDWKILEFWEHEINEKPEIVVKKILTRIKFGT